MTKENKRKIGGEYEKAAGRYLEQQGFQILEYNFRCKTGEIDIIAMKDTQLIFCEVKYRQDHEKGTPLEAVDLRKQRVISKCAMYYLTVHGLLHLNCRFDVIGITANKIEWIPNAFDYTG